MNNTMGAIRGAAKDIEMKDYVSVVAIDFGTSYSGYAFSVSLPGTQLSEVVCLAPLKWNAGADTLTTVASEKTPTCLLLTLDKQIVAFGYEAENKYADITINGKQDLYLFFHRFKMSLYKCKHISMTMPLEDIRGQTLSAIEVFSLSIRALKEHLARTVQSRGGVVLDNRKTNWVLTVPAIWTDTAKHFMRTSAEMADIPSDTLSIVLEPEAASVYCQTFPPPGSRDIVNKGTKYIIVDIGGGTTDITVHEKLADGSLKELTRATGDECGGTSIDNQYIQLIVRIFGGPFYNEFKKQYPDSYLSLIRGFESTKRTIQTRIESEYQNFTIPYAALNKLCQSELSDDLEKVVTKFAQSDKVKLFLDKLQIKSDYAKSFFKATTDNIVSVLRTVLLDKDASGVNYMLLVGGFANCGLVQDAIKRSFPELTIIVPEEAGTAVLKGAVLLGYKTDFISSRVIRYTYGVSVARPFDRNKHDRRRRFEKDGEVYCKNIFAPFVKSNTSVCVGKEIKKKYFTNQPFQSKHSLPIFYTDKDKIKYTDDGTCTLLGTVEVQIPNPTKHLRNVDVIFHFGGTELTVTAVDEETKRNCHVSFVIQDFR